MKKITLMSFILLLYGLLFYRCSQKEMSFCGYQPTLYILSYTMIFVNDSLSLHFECPVDIRFLNDKEKFKRIRNSNLEIKDSVLFYGKDEASLYEFFITIATSQKHDYSSNLLIYDSLFHKILFPDITIRLIGNPLAKNSKNKLKKTLKYIFEHLDVRLMSKKSRQKWQQKKK